MKVFISSTSEDLILYRQAARDVVLGLGWQPDMMEYFGTEGRLSVLEACARRVEACDVVLALIAWRRGGVPGPERGGDGRRSYTAWEIESAFHAGKPVLVLMARRDSWPQDLHEQEQEARREVEEFRQRLDRLAVFFDWEQVQPNAPESLPVFQSKVRQELVRHQARLLDQDVRLSWSSLRAKWMEEEKIIRASIRKQELENRQDLPLPEMELLWLDLITKPAWHEEIRKLVERFRALKAPGPLSARMIQRLGDLKLNTNYLVLCDEIAALLGSREEEEIRRSIRELAEKTGKREDNPKTLMDPDFQKLQGYRTFRFHFHQLQEQVTTPRFRRCLLLCGSTGAGKTHRTLCFEPDPYSSAGADPEEDSNGSTAPQGPASSAPWRCLILWLEPKASAARSLEEEILQGIGQMTGRSWSSLQEIDESLERAARQTDDQHGAPRLVVIIEDLHRWLRARPGFLEELAKLLDRTTQLHSLFWVISIQETAYDAITGEAREELWRRMSVTPAPRLRAFHRRRARNPESQEPEGLLGSWIDLDNLNRREGLGLKIIARESPGFTFEDIDPDERPRELAHPQIAWILLDHRDQFPPQLAVSLHFLDFVGLFWAKRWQSLASSLQGGPSLSEVEMKQVTSLVAHAMAEQAELSLEKGRLIEAAVNRGRELLQRDLRMQVTTGIPLLEAAGLLSFEAVEGGPLGAEEHLWLRSLFFWYFHLAQQLFLDFSRLSGGALEEWLHGLPHRFSRFSREDREGTLEFLLLLAEKDLHDDRAVALWRSALELPDLPQSALWLAAAKGSPWAQQLAMGFAGEQRVRTDERRTLFTFLYFLGEVKGFSPSQRTALLQPLFAAIRQADLQRYCLFVLRRILDTVKTEEEWLATASSLPGCESLERTEEIGRMMVDRAADLVEESSRDLLDLFVRYLRTENPEHRKGRWIRHFIREWILFAGFDLISLWKRQEKLGPAVLFRELRDFGWYEPKKLEIKPLVGHQMEQEANIALGHWYSQSSWPKEREELEELLRILVEDKGLRDRELGFFLIRHTGKLNQDGVIIVPPVFRKLLRRIYTDRRLDWLKENEQFRTEFRVNLPHLAGEVGQATSPQRKRRPRPPGPRRGPRHRST